MYAPMVASVVQFQKHQIETTVEFRKYSIMNALYKMLSSLHGFESDPFGERKFWCMNVK